MIDSYNVDETEIDIKELISIVRKKIWFIAVTVLIATFVSGIYTTYFIAPKYESSTTLIAQKPLEDEEIQYNDVMMSQKLVSTYGEIIVSRTVLQNVVHNLGLEYDTEALKSKVSVSAVKDTEIVKITVSDTNPFEAKKIADEIASVFITEVYRIMNVSNMQIIDKASIPTHQASPNVKLNMAIATVLGLMLSLGIVFLIEQLDSTIKTSADVERVLGLPVMGLVPSINPDEVNKEVV